MHIDAVRKKYIFINATAGGTYSYHLHLKGEIDSHVWKQTFHKNVLIHSYFGLKYLVGSKWNARVWSGLVWSGLVWSGLIWSGLVWCGLVFISWHDQLQCRLHAQIWIAVSVCYLCDSCWIFKWMQTKTTFFPSSLISSVNTRHACISKAEHLADCPKN